MAHIELLFDLWLIPLLFPAATGKSTPTGRLDPKGSNRKAASEEMDK